MQPASGGQTLYAIDVTDAVSNIVKDQMQWWQS